MSETNSPSIPTIDLTPTAALLATGSPKGMYTYFLLAACKNYFETLRGDGDKFKIESATVALIALCPARDKREELWKFYSDHKTAAGSTDSATLYASVHVVGELISYLSDVLEFLEDSTGAVL
jgi:hypothetical protein